MAIISPPFDELGSLPTPLNPGEARVLNALCGLDDGWRVYVQPRLLMDAPDFVVVHDRFGVCAVEVKDWQTGLYRQREDGRILVADAGRWQLTSEFPRYQAARYRTTIFERFFAAAGSGSANLPVIRAAVVLPQYRTAAARELLARPATERAEEMHRYVAVWGGDALEEQLLEILTGYRVATGMRVPAASLRRLETHLAEPDVIAAQRRPLRLSTSAQNLESNPNRATIRRARGPAGSGKSLGLASRAVRLVGDGAESVLVVCFNITLTHYLHDLAARHGRTIGSSIRCITFTHFHLFCMRVHEDAGLAGADLPYLPSPGQVGMEVWTKALVEGVEEAYRQGFGPRYDAVLVDEGQDFEASWWNLLRRHVRRDGGEMMLVADTTQDLYRRAAWTSETSMRGCGFAGQWTNLPGSYRLPPDLVPIVAEFASVHITDGDLDPPQAAADHLGPGDAAAPTQRRWIDVTADRVAAEVAAEVQRLLNLPDGPAPADIVFLVENHQLGLDVVALLQAGGEHISHVFTKEDDEERRRRKFRFWGGEGGIKGCTVHSYKGWESRAVVIATDATPEAKRRLYVALTRVHFNRGGLPAYVSIVNADPDLRSFGPRFTRTIEADEAPGVNGQQRFLFDNL